MASSLSVSTGNTASIGSNTTISNNNNNNNQNCNRNNKVNQMNHVHIVNIPSPMITSIENSIFYLKINTDFNFPSYSLRELLFRTTATNLDERLWKRIFKFDIDTSCLKGEDYEMNTPLESLKNPRLVYSLIMHYLGRGIFCSKLVHERFKLLLKRRVKDSCNELDSLQFYKDKLNKLNAKKLHNIDEVIVPYSLVANDFQKWTNESITWSEYINELSVREIIMNKLREKCSKFDISDSTDFFVDLMANLQLDNYCYKSLRNTKGRRELAYASERTSYWTFPLKIDIKCEQKRLISNSRTDSVYRKLKHKYIKLDYNDLEDELDPYVHGGHFRALLGNDIDELDFYLKKHPGRQIITELAFQMFGVEVQKNPAALIYNMMTLDLIDGDKLSQRECFSNKNREFTKEHGLGGVLPCSFEGNATAARYLNIYYSFIFNHWYSYDINEETEEKVFENLMNPNSEYNIKRQYKIRFEEMIQREYDLINKWITFKKERDRKARNLKTIQELWNYIFLRTQQWFEPLKFFLNEPKK